MTTHPAKHWMTTVFDLDNSPNDWAGVSYAAWQKELCPTTNRLHYQVYVRFEKKVRRAWCVSHLNRGWWAPAVHPDEARRYAMKESTRVEGPWERGRWEETPRKGRREHLILGMLLENKSEKQITVKLPGLMLRYHGGIKAMRFALNCPSERPEPEILICWGPPQCGKTMAAVSAFPLGKGCFWMDRVKGKELWWDGYNCERTIVLDEARDDWFPLEYLLKLWSVAPVRLPIKNGHVWCNSHRWIVTTNKHPALWYSKLSEDQRAPYLARLKNYGTLLCCKRDDWTELKSWDYCIVCDSVHCNHIPMIWNGPFL